MLYLPVIVLLFWLIGVLVISLSCSIFSRTLDRTAPILTRSWSPQRVRMKVCGNMSISGTFKECHTTIAAFVVLFWKSLRSKLWHTIYISIYWVSMSLSVSDNMPDTESLKSVWVLEMEAPQINTRFTANKRSVLAVSYMLTFLSVPILCQKWPKIYFVKPITVYLWDVTFFSGNSVWNSMV